MDTAIVWITVVGTIFELNQTLTLTCAEVRVNVSHHYLNTGYFLLPDFQFQQKTFWHQ